MLAHQKENFLLPRGWGLSKWSPKSVRWMEISAKNVPKSHISLLNQTQGDAAQRNPTLPSTNIKPLLFFFCPSLLSLCKFPYRDTQWKGGQRQELRARLKNMQHNWTKQTFTAHHTLCTCSNFLLFVKKRTKFFKVHRIILCPFRVLMENKLHL